MVGYEMFGDGIVKHYNIGWVVPQAFISIGIVPFILVPILNSYLNNQFIIMRVSFE